MDRAVPFADEPHAGLRLPCDGLGRGELSETLLGTAGKSAERPHLDFVGDGQAQQRRAEARDDASGELGPPDAQLTDAKGIEFGQLLGERLSHQAASSIR